TKPPASIFWLPDQFHYSAGGFLLRLKYFYLPPVELGVLSHLFGVQQKNLKWMFAPAISDFFLFTIFRF
ncbi:hypothetical protein, partial [Anaerotignum sp.]|uniref:hypothetical protein n=1 Tax=Anaerotignum sp. TaxID=2039241 RepID=UPI002A837FCB